MDFLYDQKKADSNLRKHGVSFEEGVTIFGDSLSITIPDPDHSVGEQRFSTLGTSAVGRLLVVSHLEIGEDIRIISVRRATRREKQKYEEGS
jgi:hypothetical protein